MISRDALTKLNNRNQLFQYLYTKLERPKWDKALYLLIMDVDSFKSINDHYGHIAGDQALKTVANCLMSVCENQNHFICRYGGDEFIVICEAESVETVQAVCDQTHAKLKETDTLYPISMSIRCTQYTSEVKSQQKLIERAD